MVVVSLASDVQPQAKRRAAATEVCPDKKIYTGAYRNWIYGFSIVIPAGLKGRWNSALCVKEKGGCVCASTDHGRHIPLSDGAHIEAYAGFQTLTEWSVAEHERFLVDIVAKDRSFERFEILPSEQTKLGSLRAWRFSAKFVKGGRSGIYENIVAIHKDVEYSLTLQTWADRYEEDKQKYEKVLASWRLRKRVE